MKTFDDISQDHSIWVIKYLSKTYDDPLFIFWYTDNDKNSTDKLLALKTGKIFAITSLDDIKEVLIENKSKINHCNNLSEWLDAFNELKPIENCTYDILSVSNSVTENTFDIETIEGFANFINLFGDFVKQDMNNSHLQMHLDNKFVQELWYYYYKNIFWPRFNDKEKFDKLERPKLDFNNKKLLDGLATLKQNFEDNIEIVKKTSQ